MATIQQLAIEWFDKFTDQEQYKMCNRYGIDYMPQPSQREIENIFYNEVVLKWFQSHSLYELCKTMVKDQIIAAYLEEQSKGMSLNTIQPNGKSVEKNIKTYFDNVTGDELIEQTGLQSQSVDNSIEFNKWLKDKKQRYLENKEECYNDILSSTTSAIDQFLKSPYQAQKGVLESAVKCNEMFLEFVDNSIEVRHLEQPQILKDFITAIKNEFKDENWDYLDFVADRVIENQPKVNEDNVWDEVRRGYKKLTHRSILSNGEHALLDYLEQHYLLIKK